jgi:hypothetical protein
LLRVMVWHCGSSLSNIPYIFNKHRRFIDDRSRYRYTAVSEYHAFRIAPAAAHARRVRPTVAHAMPVGGVVGKRQLFRPDGPLVSEIGFGAWYVKATPRSLTS